MAFSRLQRASCGWKKVREKVGVRETGADSLMFTSCQTSCLPRSLTLVENIKECQVGVLRGLMEAGSLRAPCW